MRVDVASEILRELNYFDLTSIYSITTFFD